MPTEPSMSGTERTEPGRVIHLIRAWSGRPEDESPLCGADKWAPDVWGNRTIYRGINTCPACLAAEIAEAK